MPRMVGFVNKVEVWLLPGFEGVSTYPEATLTTNEPAGFKCQWFISNHENKGNVFFTINSCWKSREDAYCPWRRQIAVRKGKRKEMLSN